MAAPVTKRGSRPFRDILYAAISLLRPYWVGNDKGIGLLLLVSITVLKLIIVGTTVLFTIWQGDFFNSLEDKNWADFLSLLFWWKHSENGFAPSFLLITVIFVPATVFAEYFSQKLYIRWREWETDRLESRWLEGKTYYDLETAPNDLDNPDQRISEDIRLFIDFSIKLGFGILTSVFSLLSFLALLWALSAEVNLFGPNIPGSLVWTAILYSLFGTLLSHFIGRRLIKLNAERQKVEANYRYGLVRIRDNAEGIAIYDGEPVEEKSLTVKFSEIVKNWRSIIFATRDLNFFTTTFGQLALVFPLAVVAPAYFAGRIPLGVIFQTSNAFIQVQAAFSWIVDNYEEITEWAAAVDRLDGFQQQIDLINSSDREIILSRADDEYIRITDLTVQTPQSLILLEIDDLELKAGENVLISGANGSGKTSLLRTISGIWQHGSGNISLPKSEILFLPQRPYFPTMSLKSSICYPKNSQEYEDNNVREALTVVGLKYLASRLNEKEPWITSLSPGEQQKLTLARVLVLKPNWLFLDEATSSLDQSSETFFYQVLETRLPNTTCVSIAHRSTNAHFAKRTLVISDGKILDRGKQ